MTVRVEVEGIEALAVSETQSHTVPSMILIVEKPDYLGASKGDFHHGEKPISARIEHEGWLGDFRVGESM